MRRLTSPQIIKYRAAQQVSPDLIFITPDKTRPFIPEQYTQLYHSKMYQILSSNQKLRYNQLYAARTNEQFMFFESGFTMSVIQNMMDKNISLANRELTICLSELLLEEQQHFHMFRNLNIVTEPQLYASNFYYFLQLNKWERIALSIAGRFPEQLLAMLWLVLIMEEYVVQFSKEMVGQEKSCKLGLFDENYVQVHQRHLKDEARHVHIDANLIDYVFEKTTGLKKKLNVKLLRYLLRATLRPRHAGLNVIQQLLKEFPELLPHAAGLRATVNDYTYDPCIFQMINNPTKLPLLHDLLETYPEFKQAFVF